MRVDDGSLITKLTPISSRILLFLIDNRHDVISKDDVLQKVWTDEGLESSVNTLNQYISVLRRLISEELNILNAIINIPKKGLTLSPEISIIELPEKSNQNFLADNGGANLIVQDNTNDGMLNKNKQNQIKKIFYLILFIIIISFTFIYLIKKEKITKPFIQTYHNGYIGNCPIFTLKKIENNNEYQKSLNIHIEKFNLKCEENAEFYFNDNYSTPEFYNLSMLTKCIENEICIVTRINKRDSI